MYIGVIGVRFFSSSGHSVSPIPISYKLSIQYTIETDELADLMKSSPDSLSIIDASWHMNPNLPSPQESFSKAHIPGSVYFSISDIADLSTGLLATLPGQEQWVQECRRLGVKKSDTIVVYEQGKIFTGPRAAWMFRIYGAENVRILNGCLSKWVSEGRDVVTGDSKDVNDTSSDGYASYNNQNLTHPLI